MDSPDARVVPQSQSRRQARRAWWREVRRRQDVRITWLDRRLGPAMFWVALAYLAALACLLCSVTLSTPLAWRFGPAEGQEAADPSCGATASFDGTTVLAFGAFPQDGWSRGATICLIAMAALHLLIVLEWLAHALVDNRFWRRHLLYCLLPPSRLIGRDHVDGDAIWLPRIGWVRGNQRVLQRIERAFSLPMIVIALAVLPLLALEWYLVMRAAAPRWETIVFIRVSEHVIWLAFAFEFIMMISLTPNRLRYCREHWIDIAIIVLPFIAALRALRWSRLLRLHQVTKVGRAYRLRGLGMRMFRGVLVLELVQRHLEGSSERRLGKLRSELTKKECELAQVRAEIVELESQQQPPTVA